LRDPVTVEKKRMAKPVWYRLEGGKTTGKDFLCRTKGQPADCKGGNASVVNVRRGRKKKAGGRWLKRVQVLIRRMRGLHAFKFGEPNPATAKKKLGGRLERLGKIGKNGSG